MLAKDKETSYFIFSFASLLFTIGVMLFSSISTAELKRDFLEVEVEYNKEIKSLKNEVESLNLKLLKIIPSLREVEKVK